MADVTEVNSQITDAVTQSAVSVFAQAPTQAVGAICQSLAHSLALAMTNAQQVQAGMQQIGKAATVSTIATILAVAHRRASD
jgi:hypothetical protein